MNDRNPALENYIANLNAPIIDEDYGFCYIAGVDKVYFQYPFDVEAKGDLTAEQNYYLSALTVLGMWKANHEGITHPDPDINRFNCKLFAHRKLHEFGMESHKYGMNPQAERIKRSLDNMQPKVG